jgi:hypothetical protein
VVAAAAAAPAAAGRLWHFEFYILNVELSFLLAEAEMQHSKFLNSPIKKSSCAGGFFYGLIDLSIPFFLFYF